MTNFEKVPLVFTPTGKQTIYGDIPAGNPQSYDDIRILQEVELIELLEIVTTPQDLFQVKTNAYEHLGILQYDFILISQEKPVLNEHQFILIKEDAGKIVSVEKYKHSSNIVGVLTAVIRYFRSPKDIRVSFLRRPHLAETNLAETQIYNLSSFLQQHYAKTTLMRVKGNSMKGKGIQAKDIIFLHRETEDYGGDIVAADLGTGLTLKKLEYRITESYRESTRLVPANVEYDTREVDIYGGQAKVVGVAVALLRIYREWI